MAVPAAPAAPAATDPPATPLEAPEPLDPDTILGLGGRVADSVVAWTPSVVLALLAFGACWLIGALVGRVLRRAVAGRSRTVERFVVRGARLLGGLVGVALAFSVLGLGAFAAGLLASSSVVAIVLGFAFQEIGTNLVAGVFLAFNRPFKVGDIIEVEGFSGVVRDLDLRSTHVRSADGRDIFIPNAVVFSRTLVNYTVDDLRRLSFTVGIRYEDDAAAALELLERSAAAVPGVLREPAPMGSLAGLEDAVVRLELAYWLSMARPLPERASTSAAVMDRCRRALLDGGYTVSANAGTVLELTGREAGAAVGVRLRASGEERSGG